MDFLDFDHYEKRDSDDVGLVILRKNDDNCE